jgi:membrane protein
LILNGIFSQTGIKILYEEQVLPSLLHLPPSLLLLKNASRRLLRDDGPDLSASIAYTSLVSLFPFIIFLGALAGFLGNGAMAGEVIHYLFAFLPREVAETLAPIVEQVVGQEHPGLLTLGIIGTLWVTSSGIETLRLALNRAYDVRETRPFWKRRLSSIGFILIGAVGTLAVGLIMIVGPFVEQFISARHALSGMIVILSALGRFIVCSALLSGLICFCYWMLPAAKPRHACWPGALLATFLWLILASLFSLYLSYMNNYNATYGSLGGVVITLLFLHFSALLFLFGAEYNVALQHEVKPLFVARGRASGRTAPWKKSMSQPRSSSSMATK